MFLCNYVFQKNFQNEALSKLWMVGLKIIHLRVDRHVLPPTKHHQTKNMTSQDFPPLFINLFVNTMGMNAQEFELFCTHFREMTLRKKDYYLKEGYISNAT